MPPPQSNRYHAAVITTHWLTLLLLIPLYTLIELHSYYPKGSVIRENLKSGHFTLGLLVLALVIVRLVLRRIYSDTPPIVPPLPRWQQIGARAMHITLYVFLIVMPILGWSTLSAKGNAIPFFRLELPPLLAVDKPFGKELENIHRTIGHLGYYLIGIHAAAALLHHYIMRDNTLRRMLPGRRNHS